MDVHTFLAQRTEHRRSHTYMAAHANADNADLGNVLVTHDFRGSQSWRNLVAQQFQCALVVPLIHREGEISLSIFRDVLNDDVDFDIGIANRAKDGRRNATNRDEALAWFGKVFTYIRRCPHLLGVNDRGWTADLGWLVKADNFAKVQQGNYDVKTEEAA